MKKFISKLVFLVLAMGVFLGAAAPRSWASGDFTASPLHEFVPELVPSAKQIAAGKEHTCTLMVGGTVRCWGNNDYGQ